MTERLVCPQHDALLERLDVLARGQEGLREEMRAGNEKIRERFDSVCNSLADAREKLAGQNGYRRGSEHTAEGMNKWTVVLISSLSALVMGVLFYILPRL